MCHAGLASNNPKYPEITSLLHMLPALGTWHEQTDEAHLFVIVMMSVIFILNCMSHFISFRKLACLPKMTLHAFNYSVLFVYVSVLCVTFLSVDDPGIKTGHYHSVISMLFNSLQIG